MRIGIPNTLFTAYHLTFWQEFFSRLGVDTVISSDSCKETIDTGSKLIPHEFCIPIKAFLGHIVGLATEKVDLILVPRLLQSKNREFFCPKITGLPEIVKYTLEMDDAVFFTPSVTCNGLNPKIIQYPQTKIRPVFKLNQAQKSALHNWKRTLAYCRKEQLTLSQVAKNQKNPRCIGEIRLGLLGYAYILYDPFMSKGLIPKLTDMGCQISTWEMLEDREIEKNLKELKRPMFWNFGKVLLGAGLDFLTDSEIDGLIYVTPFGCGPDSITVKLLSMQAAMVHKPFLQIILDEHSEDGHLKTRLEAFVDMLAHKKEGQFFESNVSLLGSGTRLSENV
jgi:predicted nucleotide-binding protein (sugar kinase/HSP70/actin superfamily)